MSNKLKKELLVGKMLEILRLVGGSKVWKHYFIRSIILKDFLDDPTCFGKY